MRLSSGQVSRLAILSNQALVVQTLDSAIHRINHYPADSVILLLSVILTHWIVIYPVDSAIQHLNNRGQEGKWLSNGQLENQISKWLGRWESSWVCPSKTFDTF